MGDATDGEDGVDGVLDPRIQIELENLNNATDEINRLEIALDEANTTFRILLNDCTRRLKGKSKSLGSCVEKARPYYEALEVYRLAQAECQRATVHYQRANEIHRAAKETVALAEQRFLSKQHEWQFDNAWQEMLNHATSKVRDAEIQKAESEREHHKRTVLFNTAEQKVQQLEQRLHRHIIKSKPYFEEKSLCNEQLAAQKERVEDLQSQVAAVKGAYAASLKELERISEEIHCKRSKSKQLDAEQEPPCGPREPGVGAELDPVFSETPETSAVAVKELQQDNGTLPLQPYDNPVVEGERKTVTEERVPQSPSSALPAASPSAVLKPTQNALPLLDNLNEMRNSIGSSLLCSSASALCLPDSSEIFQRACMTDVEFGKEQRIAKEREEAFNHALLNDLMENYESELDRCDMTSLSGVSVATGSSAVSEKDESESYLEEELENIREQLHDFALGAPSESIFKRQSAASKTTSLPGSGAGSNIHSASQSPAKTSHGQNPLRSNSRSCSNIVSKLVEPSEWN